MASSTDLPSTEAEKNKADRGQWSGKLDFLISLINFAVGLGNVWRFPYLCYENGGGIGYASMTIVAFYNIYFIVVVSWICFYLVSSFTTLLPWQHCGNQWNTEECQDIHQDRRNFTESNGTSNLRDRSSVVEFWELRVLGITPGIETLGNLRWELTLYLVAAWIFVYFVIWKGLHQSGKVMYITAVFPYLILLVLLIRGLTLEGAVDGVLFYVTPVWEKLREPKVWIAAGTQVLFTFGIGFGSIINLGSYNKFDHNFYRDSVILCIVNPMTSILAGFVIFSVLGYMARVQGIEVSEVVKSGPGLAFLTYPEVVVHLPLSPVWAVLFFVMLFILGINSQFCTVEALVTSLVDEWPEYLQKRRKLVALFMCTILCLLGLPMVTQGGMYIFQLMDSYGASGIPLLFTVFFQTIAVAWIYGVRRLSKNIHMMIGVWPGWYLKIGWTLFIPLVTTGIFLFSIIEYKPIQYAKVYTYPWWGEMMGWGIALSSMIWIPCYAAYYICTTEGTIKERLQIGITPTEQRVVKESSETRQKEETTHM